MAERLGDGLPEDFALYANYPNPFNPSTQIRYALPVATFVRLRVYDIAGQLVRELDQGYQEAGLYGVRFAAKGLASGVYFYSLQTREFAQAGKMLLLK